MNMRKIIALLLALVMVCSIIPMAVFAEGETTTVTTEIKTYAADNGWKNSTKHTTLKMDDVIMVTASGGENTGKYYDSGNNWRLYETEKATLKIEATDATIISVKVTYTVDKGGALLNGSAKVSSGSVVNVNADSVTLAVEQSSDGKNGQVRVTKIEVTYTTGSTSGGGEEEKPCEHEYINEYDATCEKCANGDREVTLPEANSVITIEQAQKLYDVGVTDTVYKVTGTIADDPAASSYTEGQYKFTVSDGTNTIKCYYTPVADGVVPAKGDAVTVTGKLAGYDGVVQFGSDALAVVTKNETPEQPEQPEEPKVEYAEIKDGTYLFVTDGKAMSNLVESKTYGYPKFVEVTVTDGVATGYANTDLFTITNVEGGFTIQDSYGRYYYMTGTYDSFNVSAEVPAEGHIWQAVVTEGGVLVLNVLKEKTLAYSADYSSFGIYADKSSVMTLVAATAIEEPETPETPENPENPEEPKVPETLAEQIAEANKLNNGEHLPYESTITGTIIDEPKASDYNEGQYKFTVSDGTNTILCYYTPVADGVVPAKGDTATVVGKLTAYAGSAQFDETAIAVVVNNVPEQPENPEQPGTGDEAPETSGVSIVAMAVLSVLSGSALVLLKKKEF